MKAPKYIRIKRTGEVFRRAALRAPDSDNYRRFSAGAKMPKLDDLEDALIEEADRIISDYDLVWPDPQEVKEDPRAKSLMDSWNAAVDMLYKARRLLEKATDLVQDSTTSYAKSKKGME